MKKQTDQVNSSNFTQFTLNVLTFIAMFSVLSGIFLIAYALYSIFSPPKTSHDWITSLKKWQTDIVCSDLSECTAVILKPKHQTHEEEQKLREIEKRRLKEEERRSEAGSRPNEQDKQLKTSSPKNVKTLLLERHRLLIQSFLEAPMIFGVPKQAQINVPIEAILSINGILNTENTTLESDLHLKKKELRRSFQNTPRIEQTIPVSPKLRANISGTGFEIQTITPEQQNLSSVEITSWNWLLTPKISGKLPINISIYALDEGEFTQLKTFSATINVSVQKNGFWNAFWGLINPTVAFLASLAGIISLLLTINIGKNRRPTTSQRSSIYKASRKIEPRR